MDEDERDYCMITVYVRVIPKDIWIRTKIDVRSSMGAVKDKILAKVKLPVFDPTLHPTFFEDVQASRAGSLPKAFVARSPTQVLSRQSSSSHLAAPDLQCDNWASPSKPGKGKAKDRLAVATDLLNGDPGRGGVGKFGIVTLTGQGHFESIPLSPLFGFKPTPSAKSGSSPQATDAKVSPTFHRAARSQASMSSFSTGSNDRPASSDVKHSSLGRSETPPSDVLTISKASTSTPTPKENGASSKEDAGNGLSIDTDTIRASLDGASLARYKSERDLLRGNQEALRKEQEAMALLSPTLSSASSSSKRSDAPPLFGVMDGFDQTKSIDLAKRRYPSDDQIASEVPKTPVTSYTHIDQGSHPSPSTESLSSSEDVGIEGNLSPRSGALSSRPLERERSGTITASDVARQRHPPDSLSTPKVDKFSSGSPMKATPSSVRQMTRLAGINIDEISKSQDDGKLQHPMSRHFCLYSYSSGQLLKDHLTVASYRIRPFELLEVQFATPQDRIYLPRSRHRLVPRQPLPNPTMNSRYLEPFCEGYCYVFKPGSGSNKAIKAGLGVWKLRWMSIRGRHLSMHRCKPLRSVEGEPSAELGSWSLSEIKWVASERADGVTSPRLHLQSCPDITTVAFGPPHNIDPSTSVTQTLSIRCINHLDFGAFFHAFARSYLLYEYGHREDVESTAMVGEWRRRALARATIAGQGGTVLPGRAGRRGGRNALSRPRLRPPNVKRDFDNADRWSSESEEESIQSPESFEGFSYGLLKMVEPRPRYDTETESTDDGRLRWHSPSFQDAQLRLSDQTSGYSGGRSESREGREKTSMRSRGLSFAQAARHAFINDGRKKVTSPEAPPSSRQWRNSSSVFGSPATTNRSIEDRQSDASPSRGATNASRESNRATSNLGRSRAHTVSAAWQRDHPLETSARPVAPVSLSSKASVPSLAASMSSARNSDSSPATAAISTRAALLRSLRPGSKAGPR